MNQKQPILPKWPFYLADVIAIFLALFIGLSGEGAITITQIMLIVMCVAAGIGIMLAPFFVEFNIRTRLYKIDHDEEAWSRVKHLEEAVEGVRKAGDAFDVAHSRAREEMLERMTAGFKELTDKLAGASKGNSVSEKVDELAKQQKKTAESLAGLIQAVESSIKSKDGHSVVLEEILKTTKNIPSKLEMLKSSLQDHESKLGELVTAVDQMGNEGPAHETAAKLSELEGVFRESGQDWKKSLEQLAELQKALSYIIATKRTVGGSYEGNLSSPDEGQSKERIKRLESKEGVRTRDSLMAKAFSVTPESGGSDSAIERIISDQHRPLDADGEESSEDNRKNLKKSESPELAIFDDEAIQEKPKKPLLIKQETKVVAHALVGIGNKPYIRGDGPGLNWEKGVEMDFVEVGKWEWRTRFATKPVFCTILLNDEIHCDGKNFKLEPGETLSVSPRFVDK